MRASAGMARSYRRNPAGLSFSIPFTCWSLP